MPYRHEPEAVTEKQLFIGLDLGQSKDYSAIAFIECNRLLPFNADEEITALNVLHLERWKRRTSYPQIVADTVKMINGLKKFQSPDGKPVLAIDATGVGAPVVDLFKRETIKAELKPIQIVGGATVSEEFGVTRVPKRDLVSVVQVALQNRILHIAERLPAASLLRTELENFQTKITEAANDVYGAWREGQHDDLVLATALALWCANRPVFRITEKTREMFRRLAL